jgi:hypothetical protein
LLLALLGPPCRFTKLCIQLAQTALGQLHGGCQFIHANSLEQFKEGLSSVLRPPVLLYADVPEEGLLEVLKLSGRPFVVVAADPIDVVRDLMSTGSDIYSAIRVASLHFSTVDEIALHHQARVIRRSAYEYDVEDIVRVLMAAVDRSLKLDEIDTILGGLFPEGQVETVWSVTRLLSVYFQPQNEQHHSTQLHAGDIRLIERALGDFSNMGQRRFGTATWDRELFMSLDTKDNALPAAFTMVGPARFVVFGPYIHLPSGAWVGALSFKFWNNFGRVPIRLDVYTEQVEFEADAELPPSGSGEFSFHFQTGWPLKPVQVRLLQTQGAIDGDMEVAGAWIRRDI